MVFQAGTDLSHFLQKWGCYFFRLCYNGTIAGQTEDSGRFCTIETKTAMAKAERKTESFPPSTESRRLVRVGEGAGCSTFRAADESRKGKPFIAVQSGLDLLIRTNWVATREICSRPCLSVGESFFSLRRSKKHVRH